MQEEAGYQSETSTERRWNLHPRAILRSLPMIAPEWEIGVERLVAEAVFAEAACHFDQKLSEIAAYRFSSPLI